MSPIERRPLGRTDLTLTTLGFGGGPIGWREDRNAESAADEVLAAAWKCGIRYFDSAPFYGYGNSERRIGRFLGQRRRDDYVLSSKVGRLLRPNRPGDRSPDQVVFDYSYSGAMRSISESLERLGLDRIDIALIHDIDGWTHGANQPQRFREALVGAYRALSDLKAQGVVRAIGLGINEWPVCEAFARQVPVDCFLLAGQHTLLRQQAARAFVPFCAERGIGLIVGGPYNSGILASGAVAGAQYDYAPASPEILARVGRIEAICAQFGVTLAAAALAFTLRAAPVAAVIPGVASLAELAKTVAHARLKIPKALWTALAEAEEPAAGGMAS